MYYLENVFLSVCIVLCIYHVYALCIYMHIVYVVSVNCAYFLLNMYDLVHVVFCACILECVYSVVLVSRRHIHTSCVHCLRMLCRFSVEHA